MADGNKAHFNLVCKKNPSLFQNIACTEIYICDTIGAVINNIRSIREIVLSDQKKKFFHKVMSDALDTGNNAGLTFVQLWLVGANVAPYVSQSQELLTAELQGR